MNLQNSGRMLGIPLRPWAGMSPARLALQGLIHTAIGIFALYWSLRIAGGKLSDDTELATIAGTLRMLAIPAAIFFVVFTLYGLLRLAVGILDFVPRHDVQGLVVATGSRQFGDMLPRIVQNPIWNRSRNGYSGHDNRRIRHELVLETATGTKTFTVNPGSVTARMGRGPGWGGADQSRPSWATASRSDSNSATEASIRVREKSLISKPCTIEYSPLCVVTGNELMMPSGTP
ncbi:hypothetical protein ABIB48_001782 [Arthrobacter sp. UYCu511]